MLSKILSKEECASCKFCCSFRRQSLWETPLFDEKQMNAVLEKYPGVKFTEVPSSVNQSVRNKKIYTVKLSDKYKTDRFPAVGFVFEVILFFTFICSICKYGIVYEINTVKHN